jgi:hypothetical protein
MSLNSEKSRLIIIKQTHLAESGRLFILWTLVGMLRIVVGLERAGKFEIDGISGDVRFSEFG